MRNYIWVKMKKVLIITYYWPPSGGGGVQRWLKFSKYLPEYNWQPIIFTPDNPDFHTKDPSLLKDVSKELEVLKFPIWEPYTLYNKLFGGNKKSNNTQGLLEGKSKKSFLSDFFLWIRGNFFIPDPRIFWVNPSVDFLKDYILDNSIEVIVTTGPPHSMHLIGLKLKKKIDIRWIADFRDPWVRWDMLNSFHLSYFAKRAHRRMESAVVRQADRVISVSDSWAEEIKQDHEKKAYVVTNGFDQSDFTGKEKWANDKFRIAHCGLINRFRDPEGLWKVLSDLCSENEEFNDSLEILFAGTVEPQVIDSIRNNTVLAPKFKFEGYLSHEDVLDVYRSSSVLLLLLNRTENAKGHIPGKLFEYLASNRHILAIGDINGDSANIISKTQIGETCGPEDLKAIKKAITSFFSHFKNGKFPDKEKIEEYSHAFLTKKIVAILEDL